MVACLRFGDSQSLGRIATGLKADITAIEADPAGDVRAFAKVTWTMRDGKVIYDARNQQRR